MFNKTKLFQYVFIYCVFFYDILCKFLYESLFFRNELFPTTIKDVGLNRAKAHYHQAFRSKWMLFFWKLGLCSLHFVLVSSLIFLQVSSNNCNNFWCICKKLRKLSTGKFSSLTENNIVWQKKTKYWRWGQSF